jgi:outer membrane protein assembly factor BamD
MQRLALPLLLIVITSLILGGCSRNKGDRDMSALASELMEKGNRSLEAGNWTPAINAYETLEARFPFANETKQAQLNLIYAYYSNAQPEASIEATEQFERENPTHPRMDYALYMRGLAQFSGEKGKIHDWFRIDVSRRPPVNAQASFAAFRQLVRRFPDSAYADDARQRMIFLRNRLAKHENHIARYYYERGAYAAAIKRADLALQKFDGAPHLEESLIIMVRSYRKLGMQDMAADAERILRDNYSGTQLAELKDPWYQFWK